MVCSHFRISHFHLNISVVTPSDASLSELTCCYIFLQFMPSRMIDMTIEKSYPFHVNELKKSEFLEVGGMVASISDKSRIVVRKWVNFGDFNHVKAC